MAKNNEVVRAEEANTAVALPDYLQNYQGRTGAEDIDVNDISVPRIKLGQALTQEVKDGVAAVGDLFLNIDSSIVAKAGEPLRFIPIIRSKEYILWSPDRTEGILARAHRVMVNGEARYEWDKQNETFDVKIPNGPKVTWKTMRYVDENDMDKFGSSIPGVEDSKPAATAHHNYVVSLPDNGGLIAAFSLSRSSEKRAKDLNSILRLGDKPIPIQARLVTVKTTQEHKGNDEYANYRFSPSGFVDQQTCLRFIHLAESMESAGYTVDQSNDDGDVTESTSI